MVDNESLESILGKWKLSHGDREYLEKNQFQIFLNLKQLKIEMCFLDACLEKWDPSLHVYKFNFGEACPLLEEIGAISGWNDFHKPIALVPCDNYKPRFVSFLNLSPFEVNSLFVGDG